MNSKKLLILAIFFSIIGCATRVNSINNLSELQTKEEVGYLAIDVQNHTNSTSYLILKNVESGDYFRMPFSNPSQPINSVSIFGSTVWEEKVGDPVTIPFNIIPLNPGKYIVKYGNVKLNRNTTFRIDSDETEFEIKKGEVTFVGSFSAKIKSFLFIFPYGVSVTNLDYSKKEISNILQGIPHTFTEIGLQ